MVYEAQVKENEAYLTNTDLFGSNKLFLLAKSLSFGFVNMTSFQPVTKVDILASGETIGDSVNLERRKGTNTYNGYGGLQIKISGIIDLDNLGLIEDSDDFYTITPGIIYTLILNGNRRYYFYDGKVVKNWLNDPDYMNMVETPYTDEIGIPVIIDTIDVSTSEFDNTVNYSMTLREDRSSD